MAALRLLSRRVCICTLPSLSNSIHSLLSASSSTHHIFLSRYFSGFSLSNVGLDRGRVPVRSQISLHPFPVSRLFITDVVRQSSVEQQEGLGPKSEEQPNTPIKPPPRPFKLNDEQRKLAKEVGYKVVDRYTEEDFGHNKRPKAFAVVQVGSHQFKVSPNDLIYTEKLKFCDINDKLMLNKVLLLGSKSETIVGRPVVPKAAVFAVVEEHALDEKVIIFKKKRRKNYRRTTGHRQELTRLRILEIEGINVETQPSQPSRKVISILSSWREDKSSVCVKQEGPTPLLA